MEVMRAGDSRMELVQKALRRAIKFNPDIAKQFPDDFGT